MHQAGLYHERAPVSGLAGLVRTVWIQRTGANPTSQRHLPTGGFELQFPLGAPARLIGPLTRVHVESLPPSLTVVGARFVPGVSLQLLGVPADELVDFVVPLAQVSSDWSGLTTSMAEAGSGAAALRLLQAELVRRRSHMPPPDRLVRAAVQRLMPWPSTGIRTLSQYLSISESQLRRRFRSAVGLGPKALQRTLRFQGYLALAQSAHPSARIADLAADLGYADHAHLSRECLRLTGQTPHELQGDVEDRCGFDHEHKASYEPFLATRPRTHMAY